MGETSLECLGKLLDGCERRGIPSAVVLMPEGPEFRRWYRTGVHEEMVARSEPLTAQRSSRVIDAWLWIDRENGFRDSHHLLRDSAIEYTERLVRAALTPTVVSRIGQRRR